MRRASEQWVLADGAGTQLGNRVPGRRRRGERALAIHLPQKWRKTERIAPVRSSEEDRERALFTHREPTAPKPELWAATVTQHHYREEDREHVLCPAPTKRDSRLDLDVPQTS